MASHHPIKFLETALETISSKGIKNQDLILLFPSNRAITEFKSRWKNQVMKTKETLFLPQMLTPDAFYKRLAKRIPCTQDQAVDFLESVILGENTSYSIELDEVLKRFFLTISKKLVQAFDEILGYITLKDHKYSWEADKKQIEHFFETVGTAKLYETQEEIDITSLESRKEYAWNRFPEIYHLLMQWMNDNQLATSGYMQRLAVEEVASWEDKIPKSVALIGLYAFSEMEIKLWDELSPRVSEWIFLPDADDAYIGHFKTKHAAGQFFRRYREKEWAKSLRSIQNRLKTREVNITHVECENKLVQIDYVANHLMQNPPKEGEKIAIVLFDLSMVSELVTILESRADMNIAIGYPSGEYPLYVAWLNVIKPSWNNLQFEEHLNSFTHFLTSEECHYFEQVENIQDFINQSQLWLNDFAIQSNEVNSYKHMLHQLFEQYAQEELKSVQAQYKWFYKKITSTELFFEGDKDQDSIHVIGMLETRILDYDRIYGVSFMDSIYPKDFEYNSIIPFDIRQYYLLPLPEEKEAVYAYNFYRFLHFTKELYLTTYKTNEDEVSRYFTQIVYESPILYPNFHVQQIRYNPLKSNNQIVNPYVIDHEVYNNKIRDFLKAKAISKSLLQQFFQHFPTFVKERLLNIREDQEVDVAAMQGEILHKALEMLYTPLVNRQLDIIDIETTVTRVDTCLSQALQEFQKEDIDIYRYENIYYRILKETLVKVVESDLKRYAKDKTVIKALEQHLEVTLVHPSCGAIRLKGIADCILQSADGEVTILDYKSSVKEGKAKQSPASIEELWSIVSNTDPNVYDAKNIVQIHMYAYLYTQTHKEYNYPQLTLELRPLLKGKRTQMQIGLEGTKVMESVIKASVDCMLDPNAIQWVKV